LNEENLSAPTNAQFCIPHDANKAVNLFTLDGLNNTKTYCHVQKVTAGPFLEPDESTPQQTHWHSVLAVQVLAVAINYFSNQH